MKLTPEQIQENWDKLIGIVETTFEGERKDKLLEMYDYFKDRATCVIYKESDETKNSSTLGYTITQTTPTVGNGGKDSDDNVIKEVFTITYRHPAATITGDEIMFTAKAEKIFVPPTVVEQGITAFKALNTNIPQAGEPDGRTLEIIGTNNSKFFFRRKVFNSEDIKA